jgi:hypothetical protein
MHAMTKHLPEVFNNDSGVASGYRHVSKWVSPGEPLEPKGAFLKWYGLHPVDSPIPDDLSRLARARLLASPLDARGLGFVILHRCGSNFYFLIVCTWRESNELWQTVFYKNGASMNEFEVFPRGDTHIPTLCVWELGPVWHEQGAWERYLLSARDDAAAKDWMADTTSGPI